MNDIQAQVCHAVHDYQEILVVYSNNLKCYEQTNFLDNTRTFVLVCADTEGYVAIAEKTITKGYLTLKQWVVEYPGGFSFSIPATDTYRLKCVPVSTLLAHYQSMNAAWVAIDKQTRSQMVMPLPRGNTHT